MEGVKTRAQALATGKGKMVTRGNGESELATSSLVQLKRCRPLREEETAKITTSTDDFGGRASVHVLEGSCCSSNGSPEDSEQERMQDVDLTCKIQNESVEHIETIARYFDDGYREKANRSDMSQPEKSSPPPEQKSQEKTHLKRKQPLREPPTAEEIDEFIAIQEKQHRDDFREKYNFDFEKEIPLKGRYEWVAVKPEKSA